MSRYHFIGIGGIGMSALARILQGQGKSVQGSDHASTYITEALKQSGIEIFKTHHPDNVKSASTVVYGSDIKPGHVEYVAASTQSLPLIHRSQLLAELMQGWDALLVAGTHGKTTTATLLSHVLIEARLDPTFALGGIALNTSTNGRVGQGRFFVAEADESDGTFLNYQGVGGILTNVEEEHLVYWKNREMLAKGFKAFANKISPHLWWCKDDPILNGLSLHGKSYGFSQGSDLQIISSLQKEWKVVFDVQIGGKKYLNLELPLLGKHNVLNGAAVLGLALEIGISEEQVRAAFKSFKGVKRRMEKKGENRGAIILDDYAHHPTEIQTTLEGLRKAVGEKRLIAVFQPHRFSRFKECWKGFLDAFEAADAVVVTDVYGAGEPPLEGVTASQFFIEMHKKTQAALHYAPREELLKAVGALARPHDVIITLGAGDITYLSSQLASFPIKPFKMGVLEGGKSAEHEVALLSSERMIEAAASTYYDIRKWTLTKAGEWMVGGVKVPLPAVVADLQACDVVFPVLHGPYGEDGMIQGFLETLGVPYVGCDFRACAVTMDKAWTKRIALSQGVKVARFIELSIYEWMKNPETMREKILKQFSFPFYMKAIHLGSTFGVFRVTTIAEIDAAIQAISKLDYKFLVEEEIKGRELEFGLIGTDEVEVSDAAEIVRSDAIHTYENKYSASGNPSIPQAVLPAEIARKGKEIAETVYRTVGCSGLARIDFFLDSKGEWVLNEVNPMPGLTALSAYPAIWKAEGLTMAELIDRVIISSLYRFRSQQRHLRPPEKPPIPL